MSTTVMEHVDVAIIGAGPAGLAAAHALAQVLPSGAKVAFFEKGPALSSTVPRGAGLGLDVNGVKALRAISPEVYEGVVNNHAITTVASQTRDTTGKTLQCIHDGPPVFGGTMFWRARLQGELAARFGFKERHSALYLGENRVFTLYTVGHSDAIWTASCPKARLDECGINWRAVAEARRDASAQSTDYLQRTETNGLAAKERLLCAFEGFDPTIINLIASTTPASIVEHALYTRPAAKLRPEWFGKGRVVIIGDTAHPMRPTGQGVNQGLEDALLLARYIQRDGGGFGLLDEFRDKRAARVQPIARHAEAQGKAAYKKTSEAAMQAMMARSKQVEVGAAAAAVAAATSTGASSAGSIDTGTSAAAAAADGAARARVEERGAAAVSPQDREAIEPKKASMTQSTNGQGDGSVAGDQGLATSDAVNEPKRDAVAAATGDLPVQGPANSGGAGGTGSSPTPNAEAATGATVAPILDLSGLLENYKDFLYLGEDFLPLVPRPTPGKVVKGAAA